MRIQLIIFSILISSSVFAVDDKSMKELFAKYDSVMDQKKIELIDEVFSKHFIEGNGGKEKLIDKIKSIPAPDLKSMAKTEMTWKKGRRGKNFYAEVKPVSTDKSKTSGHKSEFIIVEEDGKPKIDGTLSDAE